MKKFSFPKTESRQFKFSPKIPYDLVAERSEATSKILPNSNWLPTPSDNILPDFSTFLKVLEDFNYMGMLKERWEEIKRLQVCGSVMASRC